MLAQRNVASAITVEVARKCEALTSKAFPPRELPAADSAEGPRLDEQNYFKKCVANGGRAPDAFPKGGNERHHELAPFGGAYARLVPKPAAYGVAPGRGAVVVHSLVQRHQPRVTELRELRRIQSVVRGV
jgi:hypothetical protein